MKLSYTSIVEQPFCDYLTITTPAINLDSLQTDLSQLLQDCGCSTYDDGMTYENASSGLLRIRSNERFLTLSISGSMLEHFRQLKCFDALIGILCQYDCKITRLDATADYFVSYVPDVIKSFKNASKALKIQLSRKQMTNADVNFYLGQNEHGHETGTIYLGNRKTHSVYARIYDKTHERLSKGYDYKSQVIRVELTFKSDTGISLRDVHDPSDVFYHYAGKSIVQVPPAYTGWSPLGSGYQVTPQSDLFTPAGKILNIFKYSVDVSRAIAIAVKSFPDEALDVLVSQLRIAFKSKATAITP